MKRNRNLIAIVTVCVTLLFFSMTCMAQGSSSGKASSSTSTMSSGKSDSSMAKSDSSSSKMKSSDLIDINSASKDQLATLPGIGDTYSQKIIDGRPYNRKDDLVRRKVIPQATYDKISGNIIARRAKTESKSRDTSSSNPKQQPPAKMKDNPSQ